MVESVVNFSLEKLSSILAQQVSLLGELCHEVEQIKKELDCMRSFLRDADRKKGMNANLKTWVEQVREVAYDVEDIIDEFMHRFDRQSRKGIKGVLDNTFSFPKDLIIRYRIATQLQQIKRDVHGLSERRIRYALIEEGESSYDARDRQERHSDICLNVEDDDIVGMKEKTDLLVKWLTEEEQRRMVISVVGMGGLGKTTLVAKAYKNQVVKKHFDCCAWVCVSHSFRIEELLKDLIKDLFEAKKEELPHDLDSMNGRQLKDKANSYLQSKRYVIVLDDVWSIDAWSNISDALPNSKCGCRIMLTTRRMDVASALGDGSRDFLLKPLNEEEACNLFCKKAFWKEPCPLELQELAQNFVEKCEGVPLAIVAMGSLLASKDKTLPEWENIYNSLRWQLSNNDMLKSISSILLLSFNDLPFYLKACFLYCSIFPEDHLIHRKRLIRLWIAEGFVEEREGMAMEDVAEDYLMQLIHRSMIQIVKTNAFGRVSTCQVHDLMRDLALSKCEEDNFSMVFNGRAPRVDSKVRRLLISKCGESLQSSTGMHHLRSFFIFDKSMQPFSLQTMVSTFRFIRVLDLRGVAIESVPNELTDSFNLRYLNLRDTKIKKLPKSIGRLKHLQTLDVVRTKMDRLPNGVVKLQKLRHLLFSNTHGNFFNGFSYVRDIQVPNGICHLTDLRSLIDVEGHSEIIRELRYLNMLRRLKIHKLIASDGDELCKSIRNMEYLLNLSIRSTTEEELLQLEAMSPRHRLQKLGLYGRLEKVPCWFSSLMNLTDLRLYWSRLREDPLSSLQALPKLVELYFFKTYDGQQLTFHSGSFPRLKILSIGSLPHLNLVRIEKEAMPSIQKIRISQCSELKMVPRGIEHLTGLKELYLKNMPEELVQSLRGDGDKDHLKVQHIPNIKHAYQREGVWILESLS